MKNHILLAVVLLGLVGATSALSAVERPLITRDGRVIHGGNAELNKAAGDTLDLMGPTGSGAPYLGDFEAGWNDWTSIDITQVTEYHWQVSDYNQAVPGNLAAWSGELSYASCNDSLDVVGGYGNRWNDLMAYRVTVADPALAATVKVTAALQHDVEPGYDYMRLGAKLEGQLKFTDIRVWDGTSIGAVAVDENFTYLPGELVGGSDVYVVWQFTSDGSWSDEDCLFYGAGAGQVDDITVTVSQAGQADIVSFTDFQDGTFGDWFPTVPAGYGDYAALWSNLRDIDPCRTNNSQQVAFIDDGVVVPGTGGTRCINWCYGPGGYIVNCTGGLIGPEGNIFNDIWSPIMAWPDAAYDGVIFSFDAYVHEDLSADAPGIFFTWGIRSADTDNSAGNGVQVLAEQPFQDRNFVYYGGPEYRRAGDDVTDLMNPGRDEVQVRLGVYEIPSWWGGWVGNDGYPAPYFDNVSVKVYAHQGPVMTAREFELAQDGFPETDVLDPADLGAMHVRFDMAGNISPALDLRNDPGDSIVVTIEAVRAGATLAGTPTMHYTINTNPTFDAYRTVPAAGVVAGKLVNQKWAFDLPDTGTLFPGDVLHYYIRAADEVGGDVRWATLPADLAGFGDFNDPLAYDTSFVVHALPTITLDGLGGFAGPNVLFWNDFANLGGEAEWYAALRQIGLEAGRDYDIYYTNEPGSGVGNGVGGRTAGPALANYEAIVYTSGDLGVQTICNGDFSYAPGNDLAALSNWLATGNKSMFLSGDRLASDLGINGGAAAAAFLTDVLGVEVTWTSLRELINNQTTPLVLTVPDNLVFQNVDQWIAYGACPTINRFDAVTALPAAMRLAEFGDLSQQTGSYPYAAATLNVHDGTNRIVSLPYDLMYIYDDPAGKVDAPLSTRARVLQDVLTYFGTANRPPMVSDVPAVARFAVSNYPNPFNPSTRIAYEIKAPGHLSLKVFNVRGELVKVLVDRQISTSGFADWDGTNEEGGAVSSGVYFSEARMGDEIQVAKMALLR